MRAMVATEPGGPDVLRLMELPDPVPAPGEVLIEVSATAVNRADTLQRRGFYPPPPGASDIIGLECSGTVVAVGADARRWRPGDRVCALLAGGGYGTLVAVPEGQVMALPSGVGLVTSAALPEVACTVWSNLFETGPLAGDETVLVHGGAGGIGTFAIQLLNARGHRVFTTVGDDRKGAACLALGADLAINYRERDFVELVRGATDGRGVDIVLDNIGGAYLKRNIDALAVGGRLAIIGMQGGTKGELDIGRVVLKRIGITGSSLRPRSTAEKAAICAAVVREVWPHVARGEIRPIVHQVLPLEEAAHAHAVVESSAHIGKVLLAG